MEYEYRTVEGSERRRIVEDKESERLRIVEGRG
jgi:hypothetical protein